VKRIIITYKDNLIDAGVDDPVIEKGRSRYAE